MDWRRKLERWVGELESVTGALENALGFVQLETSLRASDQIEHLDEPVELLRGLDLRKALAAVVAACPCLGEIEQLNMAVALQMTRILDAGRGGFVDSSMTPTMLNVAASAIGTAGATNSSGVREAVNELCSVM